MILAFTCLDARVITVTVQSSKVNVVKVSRENNVVTKRHRWIRMKIGYLNIKAAFLNVYNAIYLRAGILNESWYESVTLTERNPPDAKDEISTTKTTIWKSK